MVCFAKLSERKGFWVAAYADLKGSLQLLTSSRGKEIKCCQEPLCVGEFRTESFLARPRRKMFPAVFVEGRVEMGIFLGVHLSLLLHVGELPAFFFSYVP